MSTTFTTRIKLLGCRVVGVTTNAVKATGRITIEHDLDQELADVLGPLGYWARQELQLSLDLQQQQAPLPLRTDLTTERTAEVQEVLDKIAAKVKRVTVTGAGRTVEVTEVPPVEGWTDVPEAAVTTTPPAPMFFTGENDPGNERLTTATASDEQLGVKPPVSDG